MAQGEGTGTLFSAFLRLSWAVWEEPSSPWWGVMGPVVGSSLSLLSLYDPADKHTVKKCLLDTYMIPSSLVVPQKEDK